MKLPIQIYSAPFPECPHLKQCGTIHRCDFLSDAIGRDVETTNAFCNKICNGGQKKQQTISIAKQNWQTRHLSRDFVYRVLDSYETDKARPIGVPKWWADAAQELSAILSQPFVKSINISGSGIYSDQDMPEHDLDLVINLTSFHDVPTGWHDTLPKTVQGKVTDWFCRHDWYDVFPQLDCQNKLLHVPNTFPMAGRIVEDGIQVVTHESTTVIPAKPKPVPVAAPVEPWNVQMKSRGLGDSIAKFTNATGIQKVVKKVVGERDCGCKGRQKKLNKLLPFAASEPAAAEPTPA